MVAETLSKNAPRRVGKEGVKMTGYTSTPLAKKLGIKPGTELLLLGAPDGYLALLDPLPEDVRLVSHLRETTDMVHFFSTQRPMLETALVSFREKMRSTAVLWISWPKKSARVPTDITEDVIRELALPMGLVDIKVCAIDNIWSGLKLVIRKELRT